MLRNIGERARPLRAARNRHAKLSAIGVIPNLDGTMGRRRHATRYTKMPRPFHALVTLWSGGAARQREMKRNATMIRSLVRSLGGLSRLSRIRALNGRFRDERVPPPWGVSVTAGNSRRMSPVSGHADYVKV